MANILSSVARPRGHKGKTGHTRIKTGKRALLSLSLALSKSPILLVGCMGMGIPFYHSSAPAAAAFLMALAISRIMYLLSHPLHIRYSSFHSLASCYLRVSTTVGTCLPSILPSARFFSFWVSVCTFSMTTVKWHNGMGGE